MKAPRVREQWFCFGIKSREESAFWPHIFSFNETRHVETIRKKYNLEKW